MSGIKRSPPIDFSQSKRSKLLSNNINSSEMNSHLVGTSKNGLNSKLNKPLAKPAGAINHTKPTTKKLVIKNLKGMVIFVIECLKAINCIIKYLTYNSTICFCGM